MKTNKKELAICTSEFWSLLMAARQPPKPWLPRCRWLGIPAGKFILSYGAYSGEVIEIMRQSGSKILEDALLVAKAAGVPADTELFDNFGERLAEVVADAATRFKADLIVVGTHGRRGLGRMMLGSGAEQIIRLAPVPVLVIRHNEKNETSK